MHRISPNGEGSKAESAFRWDQKDCVWNNSRKNIVAVPLRELASPKPDCAEELLRNRFLCRGGGLLLVGPTGVGKSSFSMQAMMLWALGRECFGIIPARPLKSLLIQAENDDGDLAEMRDGVASGLRFSDSDIEQAQSNILVYSEDTLIGNDFLEKCAEPLLRENRPDLLWIDPALAYIRGDVSSQREVGRISAQRTEPAVTPLHMCVYASSSHERAADWQG
jgi:RecA-family ATPase